MTQVEVSTPYIAPTPATPIRETEFWIAAGKRPEFPSGGMLGKIDFPLSLPVDATVSIAGNAYRVASVGLIFAPERAVLVYSLR